MQSLLIIGVDSYIGLNLKKFFIGKNWRVFGTTKKLNKVNKKTFFFNLEKPNFDFINYKFDAAIVCASITSVKKCQQNPKKCEKINYLNTVKLIDYLTSKSIFTLFISSNLVFDGKKAFVSINEKPKPISKYGKFKYSVERHLKSKQYENCSILRLTKVVGHDSKLIKSLKLKLKKNKLITYDQNYLFSPIQINTVNKCIYKIVKRKSNGLFQIGGRKEYTLETFIKFYLKRNFKVRPKKTKVIKWKNYHNSQNTFLPFKIN